MSNSTRYILIVWAWLMVGMTVSIFKLVEPGGLAWWLLAGVPAMIVLLFLGLFIVVLGIALYGIAIDLDRRPRGR